jgi:hypothetical protein
MNAATLQGIRMIADEMAAAGCTVKAGDKIRTQNGGGHYCVRKVEWVEVIGEYVLTVSCDCDVPGTSTAKIRLPLSCFAV